MRRKHRSHSTRRVLIHVSFLRRAHGSSGERESPSSRSIGERGIRCIIGEYKYPPPNVLYAGTTPPKWYPLFHCRLMLAMDTSSVYANRQYQLLRVSTGPSGSICSGSHGVSWNCANLFCVIGETWEVSDPLGTLQRTTGALKPVYWIAAFHPLFFVHTMSIVQGIMRIVVSAKINVESETPGRTR